ncbi:L,D-transpeptidase [Methylocapsa polymorpha]|uniref:L,D-transpeptidase n=1 Tax=Methylocapsa polymorpha TaxID=3080828 RepID=A0ABZ0HV65_9HYPH|nr:L,D-transpeptidase [Methylocapsa sp. RX1]
MAHGPTNASVACLGFLALTLSVVSPAVPAAAQGGFYSGYQAYPYPYYEPAPTYPDAYPADPAISRRPGRHSKPSVYREPVYDAPWEQQPPAQADCGSSDREDPERGVDQNQTTAAVVRNPTQESPGTIVVDIHSRHLYLVQPDGSAIRYGIGVGRRGFEWKGVAHVERKAEWPSWFPPKDMLSRRPNLPDHMGDGLDNPLGTRALYLYQGDKDTLFHIHGTNEPETIGKAASSGCTRMMKADAIDLYKRVEVGARVVVH